MERNGIDKLKKACIILPLVVAVIFNSSVAAIDRENNSKLSCGIDSYYVKDMIAQDDHIWLLLHDSSIDKDAVACINEKTLELQACYRSGEDLEDEMIIQNMSVQPNGSVWLDLFYPKNPKGSQYSLFILQDNVNVAAASNVVLCENVALWENGSSLCYWDSDEIVKSVDIPADTEPYAISALNGRPCFVDAYTGKVFLLNEHGKWINQYSIPVSDNKVLPQEFVNFYASMTSCGNEVYLSYLVGPEKSNSLNRGGLVRLSDGKRLGDTAGLIVHAKKQNDDSVQLYMTNGFSDNSKLKEYQQLSIKSDTITEARAFQQDGDNTAIYLPAEWQYRDNLGRLWGWSETIRNSITCIDTDSLTDTDSKFSASTDYYGFLDADESAWYGSQQQGVIKSVVQLGIMNGYTDGTFHPIGNITLSEAIKMAAVVHATCNNQAISFSASDGGKWYDAYLNYCVKNRIVSSDEYSSLDAYATRAQIAHIFAKATSDFAVVNDIDYDYISDVSERSEYADEILALYRAGILTGDERTRAFRPSDTITRAEAAAIISRVALPTTRIKIV
ncbi:S-layer homology domain-containing protein [Ruminococcaceae bacterium TF06-43]|nr:S-layer homology domain-containing protein [Ruminococcaceae bacterium TF06-43]